MTWRDIALRPYRLVWRNLAAILLASVVPATALTLSLWLVVPNRAASGAAYIAALLFIAMLCVDLHRVILRPGDSDVRLCFTRVPRRRDWKYFGVLFLYLIFDRVSENLQSLFALPDRDLRALGTYAVIFVIFLFVWRRVAFVLPAIATDTDQPLRHAWRSSGAGYAWFWFGVVAIVPGVFVLVFLANVAAAFIGMAVPAEYAAGVYTLPGVVGVIGFHILYTATTANLYALETSGPPRS